MTSRSKRKSTTFRKEDSIEEETDELSHFEAHASDDSQTLWDVVSILRESQTKYQVEWAGINPDTGKNWNPTWIAKEDCTDHLIQDWKAKKRERKEAKKLATRSKKGPPPPKASSRTSTHRSSLTASLRSSEDTVILPKAPVPTRGFHPVVQIYRKRRRSPLVREEIPPSTPSAAIASEPESHDVARPQKRRRILDSSSSEGTPAPPDTGRNTSPLWDEKDENGSLHQLQDTSSPPSSSRVEKLKPRRNVHQSLLPTSDLGPVPQMTPTIFREKMGVPSSQIEQFSTPGSSPQNVTEMLANDSELEEQGQPEPAVVDTYDVVISPSRVHQLKPKKAADAWSSPRASSSSSSALKSNPMDALPFRKTSRTSRSRSREKRMKDLESRIVKWDSVIESQQATIASINKDRASLQQKLEDERREHALSKQGLEAQITALTESIQATSLKPPDVPPLDVVMVPPPIPQRSPEDEALITQLREEVAKLQDTSARQRAEISYATTMGEQARELAGRAEVAKMELAKRERIAREAAQNAPKIAKELYSAELEALKAELEKSQVQNNVLLEQSRLTGDNIRRKAARYDVLLEKYNKLSVQHEDMFKDLVQAENEKDLALEYMIGVQRVILQVQQGPADLATLLQMLEELNGGTEEQESGDEEGNDDEMQEDSTSAEEESAMDTDHGESRPIVEERSQSYDGPDLGDPPTIFIEEIEEGPLGDAFATPRPSQREKLEGLVFACLWHGLDDETCQEHRSTKQALRDHVFKDHLTGL